MQILRHIAMFYAVVIHADFNGPFHVLPTPLIEVQENLRGRGEGVFNDFF